MTSRIFLSVLFAFSASAMAAEGNGSEYQWQTPADKMELTPRLIYQSATAKYKSGSKAEITGLAEALTFEYGLSEDFSAGLILMNSATDTKTSPANTKTKQTGLHDLVAFFHGRTPVAGSLRYGADLSFALAKDKTESNGDSNNATGGIGLTPFIGWEIGMDKCIYGARIAYQLYLGERNGDNNGAAEKYTGPSTLMTSLFMEHQFESFKLGAALKIENTSSIKTKVNGNTTDDHNTLGSYTINLYAPVALSESITLLPEFNYTSYTVFPKDTIDSINGWDLGVAGRFAF